MGDKNDMSDMVSRAEMLIDSITSAIMRTTEVAAERINLAAEIAAMKQRMTAFGSVLEAVAAQKEAIQQRLDVATGASRALLQRNLDLLALQEQAILVKVGVPSEVAALALNPPPAEPAPRKLYVREGARFTPLEGPGGAPAVRDE